MNDTVLGTIEVRRCGDRLFVESRCEPAETEVMQCMVMHYLVHSFATRWKVSPEAVLGMAHEALTTDPVHLERLTVRDGRSRTN